MVMVAKPQTMTQYVRPMTKGATLGVMNGFAGSRTDQITRPWEEISYQWNKMIGRGNIQ
jgi:hypothetical protein